MQLCSLLNGDWRGPLVHYCPGEACCASRTDCVNKTIQIVEQTMFSRRPAVPMSARWTKVGQTLDAVLLPTLCHNLLKMAVNSWLGVSTMCGGSGSSGGELAISNIAKDLQAKPADPEDEVQAQSQEHFRWQRGKRSQKFVTFVNRQPTPVRLLCWAIVAEPLRYLVRWLLSHTPSSKKLDPMCCGPLADIVTPPLSPVTAIQLHNSALLAGTRRVSTLFQGHIEHAELLANQLLLASADLFVASSVLGVTESSWLPYAVHTFAAMQRCSLQCFQQCSIGTQHLAAVQQFCGRRLCSKVRIEERLRLFPWRLAALPDRRVADRRDPLQPG